MLGPITSCVCGATRRTKNDDAKPCQRTVRRRAARLCEGCYGPRISGQAFTGYICNLCHEEKLWPNTGIPVICMECADAKGLCIRCGNSRESQERSRG
jgi:hypothetical protein